MKVLILGGTSFLGPAIVEVAQARGHMLALFNRGQTNPQRFPNVETLHGDRTKSELDALRGRTWDVVIDTSGYFPRAVTESATLVRDAKQYIFISSISVYAAPPQGGVDENGAVGELEDPSVETIGGETYGPLKAACERAAEAAMPGKVTVIRPGLIVGPGDPTDRFTYWPVRLDAGGEVMAPGSPSDPVQIIDVRDLAAWIVTVFEDGHTGVYNAVGPAKPIGIRELLDATKSALGSPATLTWVDEDFLASQKVSPWSDMPVWVGAGEDAGMARVSSARAIDKGLTFRPIGDTARDTLEWWKRQSDERRAKPGGWISRDREREVLTAFKAPRRAG
ncbi:MAG: NAD-dependent epimerase/dehydratase family protein [Labilithrix sp.]|nr:NAD-dependent epimerase/dehydratase family protein [Labilithrix sp.]